MSLTDRNRTHSAPAAYQPTAPTGPGQTGPKPYRHLVLLAVGLIVLAVVFAVIAYSLTRSTASGDSGTSPSVAIPSTAQTPTPTPTPTLSERDQAAAAARDGYKAYVAAYDEVTRGGDKLPAGLAATVEGPMAKQMLNELRSNKKGGFVRSGSAVAYVRVDAMSELTDKVPKARLSTCLDQNGVTVTQNGKPFLGKPMYVTENITMHRAAGGTWKVYDRTSKILKDGDCLSALGPTAR